MVVERVVISKPSGGENFITVACHALKEWQYDKNEVEVIGDDWCQELKVLVGETGIFMFATHSGLVNERSRREHFMIDIAEQRSEVFQAPRKPVSQEAFAQRTWSDVKRAGNSVHCCYLIIAKSVV